MGSFIVKDIPAGAVFAQPVFLDKYFILTVPEAPFSAEIKQALAAWHFQEVFSATPPQVRETAEPPKENVPAGEAAQIYRDFFQFVQELLSRVQAGASLSYRPISERVAEFCGEIKKRQSPLLLIQPEPEEGGDYLVSHTVKTTIISVIIGNYLKMPPYRVIELGVAAVVHEVGMTKLPQRLYQSTHSLTLEERKLIMGHPLLGFQMLKNWDFPPNVCLAALEHHECENGQGYPRRLPGGQISLYAKIIAVTCSYEALTNPRPYRDAIDGHTGILEILKNTKDRYDDTILRALVYSLSLYPVGLYVLLSDGSKGQVIDVNSQDPRYPLVRLLEKNSAGGNTENTLQTSADGISIDRPLRREEFSSL